MGVDDKFKDMFFEEARELLLSLEEGLMELERRQGDRAHLDKTFRAAHSLKGAAAMVGFGGIGDFTHLIEAVLDKIRVGKLAVDSDVISTLLEARDHLAAAVESEAMGIPIMPPQQLVSRLNSLLQDRAAAPPAPTPAPVRPAPIELPRPPAPVAVVPPPDEPIAPPAPAKKPRAPRKKKDVETPDAAAKPPAAPKPKAVKGKKKAEPAEPPPMVLGQAVAPWGDGTVINETNAPFVYRIVMKPGPEILKRGVNPLGVIDELRELGHARVTADHASVPPLDRIDPLRCYLTWTIEVETDAAPERLDDVFIFIAEDSEIRIERWGSGDPAQVVSAPPLVTLDEPEPEPFIPAFKMPGFVQASPPSPTPPAPHAFSVVDPTAPPPTAPPTFSIPPAPMPISIPAGPPTAATIPMPPPAKPAASPMGAASAPAPGSARSSPRIRVDAGQLDDLVGFAGELAVLSDNLQTLRDVEGVGPWIATLEALDRVSRLIRDTTLELRMVPVEELFSRFPRVVRDLADRHSKEIELRILGQDTRLDRTIVERLSDPMIHLIRNAVDHGMETPSERLANGKSRSGRITLSAGHEGDRVALRIEDDGRGLNREAIVKKGIAKGLVPVGTSADDPRIDTLIFEPGFSTRDAVSELSGRGVGLDVVRDAVRGLRGSLAVESTPGKGTAFIFRLPLTLALIDGLLVETAGARYVVPLAQVEECVALNGAAPALSKGRPCVAVRGELVPMVPLRKLFQARGAEPARQELLLTRHAGQRVGVAVDRLLGRVQAVIQSLGEGLGGLNRFSGATILGDGTVSLILDLAALVAESRAADSHTSIHQPA